MVQPAWFGFAAQYLDLVSVDFDSAAEASTDSIGVECGFGVD